MNFNKRIPHLPLNLQSFTSYSLKLFHCFPPKKIALPSSLIYANKYIFKKVHTFQKLQQLKFYSGTITHQIDWPRNIQKLIIWNASLLNLPSSLLSLFFDCGLHFDMNIDSLPSNLQELTLSGTFNKPINNLPSSLISLHLGEDFNQNIDHLPQSLITLIIKGKFNKPIYSLHSLSPI